MQEMLERTRRKRKKKKKRKKREQKGREKKKKVQASSTKFNKGDRKRNITRGMENDVSRESEPWLGNRVRRKIKIFEYRGRV